MIPDNAPQWVKDGKTVDARVEIDNWGRVIWHGGVWRGGEWRGGDLPPAGAGTCVNGIHVTTAARAWTYFGVDPTCQLWRVTFSREDLLDCDGEKARIRGGVFERIPTPWLQQPVGGKADK